MGLQDLKALLVLLDLRVPILRLLDLQDLRDPLDLQDQLVRHLPPLAPLGLRDLQDLQGQLLLFQDRQDRKEGLARKEIGVRQDRKESQEETVM